jgi:hypothetical protein
MDGTVDYFTAEPNVKIFGYNRYCGDGVIDSPTEACDGNALSCSNGLVCAPNYVATGTPSCVNCQINYASCYCNLNIID